MRTYAPVTARFVSAKTIADRAQQAMLKMKKIDIAALKAAINLTPPTPSPKTETRNGSPQGEGERFGAGVRQTGEYGKH